MFETLSDRLTQVFSSLRGRGRLSAADIDATAREIRIALLEADVALPVVRQFIARVKERAGGEEVSAALNPAQQVIKIVNEELIGILGGETRRLRFAKVPPTVIMLAGLQGSGKTTLAAKLALWLKAQGNTPMLVAADLQRPNAVQQLQVARRARRACRCTRRSRATASATRWPSRGSRWRRPGAASRTWSSSTPPAGLGVDEEMMAPGRAIRDATQPDEILFVVDAMIGQDAVATAQAFLDGVGYDGVVLTKLDGDARGGAALSIVELTGRPIMFASSGEKLEDFDLFHPDRMASRILDLGDILTLIEQAEKNFDAEQTANLAGRIASGEGFTLEDFVEQLSMVRKLGPDREPARHAARRGQEPGTADQVNDKDLDRAEAIVRSMTPRGTAQPEDHQRLPPGAHRQRAPASPSARSPQLVTNFFEGQKQMKAMFSGGMPGMPPRHGRQARRAAAKSAGPQEGGKKKRPAAATRGGPPSSPAAPQAAARPGRRPRTLGRHLGGLPEGLPASLADAAGQACQPGLNFPAPPAGQHPGRLPRRDKRKKK